MTVFPTNMSRNRHSTLINNRIDLFRYDTVKTTQPCAEQRKRVVTLTVSENVLSPGLSLKDTMELENFYRQAL